jgi:hypothetical protein
MAEADSICESWPRPSLRAGGTPKVRPGESFSGATLARHFEAINLRVAYNTRRGWQRVGRKPQLGVFKRKNKYWIDFYDSQKNRVQESSHSSSKRDAEDLLSIRKSEVLRGTFKRPVKITSFLL